MPAHAALFTGLLPDASGLIRAPGGQPTGCRPVLEAQGERLLPAVFAAGGYLTGAVSANLWITELSGFATGFERFHTIDTRRQATMADASFRSRAGWIAEGVRARADDGAAEAELALRGFLDEADADGRPFFAFVNLVEAHSPYLPPLPYSPLGPIGRARAAAEARRHLTLGAIWRACAGGFDVPDGALERMRALYAASVRLLDDWLARLLEDLDRRGILEETIVIVTADHGENLGENGMLGHSFSLDERLLRVPFVTAGPVGIGDEELLSLAALPNRLGGALELPDHPWEDPLPDGVAIAQFDPPTRLGDPRNAILLDRWELDDPDGRITRRFTTELICATNGRLKLQARGDELELYNLLDDPLEQHPESVGPAPSSEVDRLKQALVRSDQNNAPAPVAAAGVEPTASEVEDLEQRMRLLGYL